MSVLADLGKLPAAEEFFTYLKVEYDPALVQVARLHILRRMGQYLAGKDFTGMPEETVFTEAQDTLARAYADFAASRPIDQRVFKVLKDHDPARPAPVPEEKKRPFVPLDSLTVIG